DWNGDGVPDIATANAGDGGNVSLILQAATSDPSNPGPLDFGTQTQGTVGAGQNEFITNNGSAPLRVSSVSLTGTNPDDFIISVDTCTGSSVARFNNCRIAVKFAPQAPAGTARAANLVITSPNAANSPTSIPLMGTAGALPAGPTGSTGAAGASGATGAAGGN